MKEEYNNNNDNATEYKCGYTKKQLIDNLARFKVGDSVWVDFSEVACLYKDETSGKHLRLNQKTPRRSAKVIYVGKHYLTVEYSKIRRNNTVIGGWRESFDALTLYHIQHKEKCNAKN